MLESYEIEWKIAGFLPIPIAEDCIYYNKSEDVNYAKRIFGCPDLKVYTSTLIPTNLFHQALSAELRKKHSQEISINRFPYSIPIGEFDSQKINFRFRVFGSHFLVLSILVPQLIKETPIPEIIKLQMLSSHQLLEAIARFVFNVNYCPAPSQTLVKYWISKPLIKIKDYDKKIDKISLVEIVTRHQGMDERAITEMLEKNKTLNYNDDLLLIDKQGIVFLQRTSDKKSQRNRYKRISSLLEYALYVKSFETALADQEASLDKNIQLEANNINKIIEQSIISQSVSAHRGWELLKKEMNLKVINLQTHFSPPNKRDKEPFYRNQIFKGLLAITSLLAGLATIYQLFNGWKFF